MVPSDVPGSGPNSEDAAASSNNKDGFAQFVCLILSGGVVHGFQVQQCVLSMASSKVDEMRFRNSSSSIDANKRLAVLV